MELDKGIRDIQLNDHCTCHTKDNVDDHGVKFDPELVELITDIARREGFVTYDLEKKLIINSGGNYLGVLYEVNVKDESKRGNKRRDLNMFLKKIINVDEQMFSIEEAYNKEIFVYCELAKVYKQLQHDAKVPNDEFFDIVKCYGVVNKKKSQTIVLENMSKSGYKTCNRLECISLKFAELSIIDLARYHALGYVIKKRDTHYFDMIKKMNLPFVFNEKWEQFFRSMAECTLSKLDSDPRRRMEKFLSESIFTKGPMYYNPTKYSTVCHGDFRANNILVKEQNGEYAKTLVVDYQLIYYGCPINDFLYFIFGATDQEFRRRHLEHLKNLYHDTLGKFLKYFNIDVEDVYPRKEFDKEYRERLDYGLIISLQLLPFILASENDVPDLSSDDMCNLKITNDDDIFKGRITGIVDDYIKWGYI